MHKDIIFCFLVLLGISLQLFAMQETLPEADPNLVQELSMVCNNVTDINLYSKFNTISGDPKAFAIAKILETNTSLVSLQIYCSDITDIGVNAIANALVFNTNLEMLNLNYNKIGNKGAQALAALLLVNKTIKGLLLGGNPIGGEGIRAIATILTRGSKLQALDLFQIKNIDISQLNSALKSNCSLKHLCLCNNNISQQHLTALFEALAENTNLEDLDLRGNRIEKASFNQLIATMTRNKTIKKLNLHWCELHNEIRNLISGIKINITLIELTLGNPDTKDYVMLERFLKRNQELPHRLVKIAPLAIILATGNEDPQSNLSLLPKEIRKIVQHIIFIALTSGEFEL